MRELWAEKDGIYLQGSFAYPQPRVRTCRYAARFLPSGPPVNYLTLSVAGGIAASESWSLAGAAPGPVLGNS